MRWDRSFILRSREVAETDSGETCADTSHSFVVTFHGDERSVFLTPSQALFASRGIFGVRSGKNSKEDRACDVEFGEEDVD